MGSVLLYIPRYYRIDDREKVAALLSQNPFGLMVAYDNSRPIAVHIPFEFSERENRLVLEGHVSRGNPIWRVAPSNPEVLVVFQGPHTYISPSWYRDPNVPTWNYLAVHLYGACRVMTQPELETFLERLVERYEAGRANARTWNTLPPDFRQKEMRGIVGLTVTVERIDAAAKMSQNRNDEDFHHIVESLDGSASQSDRDVGGVMRSIRPDLFRTD